MEGTSSRICSTSAFSATATTMHTGWSGSSCLMILANSSSSRKMRRLDSEPGGPSISFPSPQSSTAGWAR